MGLDFYSQKMPADGGSLADLTNQVIKDASLAPKHVLLREVLQNSCDQRSRDGKAIDFYVEAKAASESLKNRLQKLLCNSVPKIDPINIHNVFERDYLELLVFADSGTKGLDGPTNATFADAGNFVNFFYVFGRSNERNSTDGGAFGTGRTTLNNASECSTILVYSQFKQGNATKQRLMGFANANSYSANGIRYTGRHWWGKNTGDFVEPIEGLDAKTLADELGMLEYLKSETGFVVYVIANDYVDSTNAITRSLEREQLIKELQKASILYAWPHMLTIKGTKSVNFHFNLDGSKLAEIDPKRVPVVSAYVDAYNNFITHTKNTENFKEIYFTETNKKIKSGELSWTQYPMTNEDKQLFETDNIPMSAIALMRNANFVVKYLAISQIADQISTRGVFLADKNFETEFRMAEPVAHDDWIPSRLPKGRRNPVKQAKDQILANFRDLLPAKIGAGEGKPADYLATVLGGVMGGAGAVGERIKGSKGGTTIANSPKGLSLILTKRPRIVASDSTKYLTTFEYQVQFKPPCENAYTVKLQALNATEGGFLENSPPAGASKPNITEVFLNGDQISNLSQVSDLSLFETSITQASNLSLLEIVVSCEHGLAVGCRTEITGPLNAGN